MRGFNYKVRGVEEIYQYGGNFYKEIIEGEKGFLKCVDEAYEGFEHSGNNGFKVPNMTRIWNLPFNAGGFLYGSSLGHLHTEKGINVQEIYEFFGYGGMLISSEKETKLYLCGAGDKVGVPPDCSMTILNLSFKELLTLDMANPGENKSSKDILLENARGPMLGLYHTGMQNGNEYCSSFICSSFLSHRFKEGIKLPDSGIVKMRINSKYRNFGISRDEEMELKIGSDESDLVSDIFRKRREFENYGIRVIEPDEELECRARDGKFYRIRDGLEKLAVSSDRLIYRILGMD